jgi:hypothetical protein
MSVFTHKPFSTQIGQRDVAFITGIDWSLELFPVIVDWERRTNADVEFDFPRGLWVDNTNNTNSIEIQCLGTLQAITVAPGQLMTTPLFPNRNPKFSATNLGDGSGNVGLTSLIFTSHLLLLQTFIAIGTDDEEGFDFVAGSNTTIAAAGTSQVAVTGPNKGGFVANGLTAADQGILAAEILGVNPTGAATLLNQAGNSVLQPGQVFTFPVMKAGQSIQVNAATIGHKFTVNIYQ